MRFSSLETAYEVERRLAMMSRLLRGPEAVHRVGDGWLVLDHVSPEWSRAFGLGLREEVSESVLDEAEALFTRSGITPQVFLTPFSPPSLAWTLEERGYRIVEWSVELYHTLQQIPHTPIGDDRLQMRLIEPHEYDHWDRINAAGFGIATSSERRFLQVDFRIGRFYLVEAEGEPVATCLTLLLDGWAFLMAGNTLEPWRGRGIHRMMIEQRLRQAVADGAEVAIYGADVESTSARNALRCGFQVLHNLAVMRLVD